jgi:hypothetical protein
MKRARLLILFPLLEFLAATGAAGADLHTQDGLGVAPEAVSPATGVKDPVFAFLIGLIQENLYGSVDEPALRSAIAGTKRQSVLPYEHLDRLRRDPEPGRTTNMVEARFRAPLRVPIPYEILTYNPGKLRSTREVLLREWDLGSMTLRHELEGKSTEVRLTELRLFGVIGGALLVDIDGWVDAVAGGAIDDTRVTGLALFRYEGELWGLAMGYNDQWRGRSGLLSFSEDKVRFPSPPPLKTTAWKLRQILEGLDPHLRPDTLRTRGFRESSLE